MWYLKDIQTYLNNKISNENEPEPKRHCIIAHDHNIPFISFSPCGEFIASISIDDTCRIHHVDTKKLVSYLKMDKWLWSVVWINKKHIRGYDSPKEDIIDYRLNKLYQN